MTVHKRNVKMSETYSVRDGWRNLSQVKELAGALARAQRKMENVTKGKLNPHFKSKYADLASVWDVAREPLTSEGLSVIQLPCEAPEGYLGLVTHLLHSSGESLSERIYLKLKDESNPQTAGSVITYLRRYALMGLAGIGPEDDDGNAASPRGPSPAESSKWTAESLQEASKDMLGRVKAATNDVDRRGLYAQVRGSDMPEKPKTELLLDMAKIIQESSKEKGK